MGYAKQMYVERINSSTWALSRSPGFHKFTCMNAHAAPFCCGVKHNFIPTATASPISEVDGTTS